eukprot:TRINITY_DN11075_c0_g2_i1.p1 TRINITY_DN11075_c0_g2~~TRINITY_DN11075_c0_g2_i1.p1  ORF type:complete len:572 (+),score=154.31 TRINITY_DN11075_c0_g2_i1:140-1855(+)
MMNTSEQHTETSLDSFSSLAAFTSLFATARPDVQDTDRPAAFEELQDCFNQATKAQSHHVVQLRHAQDRWQAIKRFHPLYQQTLLTPWLLRRSVSFQDWSSWAAADWPKAITDAWQSARQHAANRIRELDQQEAQAARLVGALAQWERRRRQLEKSAAKAEDWEEDLNHLSDELHRLTQDNFDKDDHDPAPALQEGGDKLTPQAMLVRIRNAIKQRKQQESQRLAPTYTAFRWPIFAGIGLGLLLTTGIWRGFNMTEWLKEVTSDAKAVLINFTRERLIEPIIEMYESIRYDKEYLALQMAKTSEAELASLQRMVTEYALDTGKATADDLADIEKCVTQGDLTVVMRDFEAGLRKPVSGVVGGHLLRTVLIQVQKAKVDMQQALSAMDKLMKSNELTFQLIALMPAVAIAYFGVSTVWNALNGRFYRKTKASAQRVQLCLQEIERSIYNACVCEPEEWLQSEGELVIACLQAAKEICASKQLSDEAKCELCEDLAGVLAAADEGASGKSERQSLHASSTSLHVIKQDDSTSDVEYFERVADRRSRRLSLIRMTLNAEMIKLSSSAGMLFMF